jgi:hypothetical protein
MFGVIIECILTERSNGTGGGQVESVDEQLKVEAALVLS